MSEINLMDRLTYARIAGPGGHKEKIQAISAAETLTDVVAGVAGEILKVDRVIICSTTTNPISVHLEDAGVQKGPLLHCPANDTIGHNVIVDYPDGAGIDIQFAGTSPTGQVYLDYHIKGAQ